ncbi:MAG: DUF6446 family protein [Pseudomonadota bacterium]
MHLYKQKPVDGPLNDPWLRLKMIGKIAIVILLLSAALGGGVLYYLQVFYYYQEVAEDALEIELTSVSLGEPEAVLADDIRAIDADSSPIRFRACFTTPMDLAMLTETYVLHDEAIPLTAPGWFDCFDAEAIADGLADGSALAFTGQSNIAYGVDRVVAIFDDGRAYAWNQLNNCGQKAYDGSPIGPDCPPRESFESQ